MILYKMKEVSDKVIVILVIIALVTSLFSVYMITKTAMDRKENQQTQLSAEPDSSSGYVSLTVVDEVGGENNS